MDRGISKILGASQFGILPEDVWTISKSVATPNVENTEFLAFANTSAFTVTDFRRGSNGQTLRILGDSFTVISHGARIKNVGEISHILLANVVYLYVLYNNVWYNIGSDTRDQKIVRTASTSTTATTMITTGLSVTIGVGQTWVFDYTVMLSCSGVGGVKIAFAALPANVTGRVVYNGNVASATASRTNVLTTFTTVNNWSTFNSAAAPVVVYATAYLVSTTGVGTIDLQYGSVTAGQTSLICNGSGVIGVRIS